MTTMSTEKKKKKKKSLRNELSLVCDEICLPFSDPFSLVCDEIWLPFSDPCMGHLHLEQGYTGTLYEGDGLGEAGLLHGHLRTETAWVEDPVQLLVLKKKDYDRKIRPLHIQAEQERIKEFRIIAALSG
jgi:hypothetical protein